MEAAGRQRPNGNTFLREIQEEDEQDRDHRSSRLLRDKHQPPFLPNIFRQNPEADMPTKKNEPFSWCRSDQLSSPSFDSANVPTGYYQPDTSKASHTSSSRAYYKSSSANRVHTEAYRIRQQSSTEASRVIEPRAHDPAKGSKINYADQLERQMFAQPVRILKNRPERHTRQPKPDGRKPTGYSRLVPRIHLKRRTNTITEDDDDETSSVRSREYMIGEPLTFGIFANDEEDPGALNIGATVPYEEIMHQLYLSIPASTEHRREESVRELCYRLYKTNSLFLKMEYLTCVEMVCSSQLYSLERGRSLFESGQQLSASYIILWGSVQIFAEDGILQGFYEAGSTICQEYLLIGAPRKIGERARAGKRGCGVLELTHNSLKTIRQNLTKVHLKKDLIMMESVFRKNYFNKKSIRNSFKYQSGGD